jgi:hypothetical protein
LKPIVAPLGPHISLAAFLESSSSLRARGRYSGRETVCGLGLGYEY